MAYIPDEEVEVWFSFLVVGDNEPMFTHLGYLTSAPVTQAGVDAGFTQFQTTFRPLWDLNMSLLGGHVIEGPSDATSRWDSSIAPVVGSGAGATLLPNNSAMLAKKTTVLGGRRNRGRMYFPNPVEANVSPAGVVLPAAITAWNTALAALMPGGAVHTAFGFLGEARLFHTATDASPAPASTSITDLGIQNKIATQRRRMRR